MPAKKVKQPLSVTHPELAKEADGWDPNIWVHDRNKKMAWLCPKGHRYLTQIKSRKRGTGCPECSKAKMGKKVRVGVDDLKTLFPEIAFEASGWDPSLFHSGSNLKKEWRCSQGHIYETTIVHRTSRGDACPYCSNHRVLVGFNDLNSLFPEIASEANGWDPTKVLSGSNKKLNWLCPRGHSYTASPSERTLLKSGCTFCSNKKVLPGFNDLRSRYPELAIEANGWDPSLTLAGGDKVLIWKCSLGHIYEQTAYNRVKYKRGCPICSGYELKPEFNDLATTHPELAKEADGWDPTLLFSGSSLRKQWKCSLGHVWVAMIKHRAQGTGCPFCAGKKVMVGFNDLESIFPQLASEAFGWDPSLVTSKSGKKVIWKCKLGHFYSAVVRHRANGTNCPVCANQQILIGFNDLATTHPELANEADGWDPTSISATSGHSRKWRCVAGHTWSARVINRSYGVGCASCAMYGYNPSKEAFIYLLAHPRWEMHQIGITNAPDDRIARHSRRGWELIELRGPMDGHLTQQWETAILRMLKAKGADLSNSKIAGKFDGYSEAWSKSIFEVSSIKELMRLTEEFEALLESE